MHRAPKSLVYLLLLVDAELTWSAVDQEQETANNGEDLEEVVLGEVLVGVVLVQLRVPVLAMSSLQACSMPSFGNLQSRSC